MADRIRILHVVGGMNRAGAETWLMNMLRFMDRDQFQMDFLLHSDQEFAYADECRSLGSELIVCKSPRHPMQYARTFKRILRSSGPYHVVHSHVHHFGGYVLRLAHESRVPVRIAHSHVDTSEIDSRAGLLRWAYIKLGTHWITRYATCLLAGTEGSARSLFGSGIASDPRLQVLPYRLNLAEYLFPVDRAQVRAELGLPADAFVIGHVGRFSPQKNHFFLMRVGAEVTRLIPNTHMLLLGVGELRPDIERRVREAGIADRVHFVGSREDLPRMLAAMDVFVFPSLYEGNPLALIAAQAAGLPCVISDAITEEADVVEALVRRVSLSAPIAVWAEAVISATEGRTDEGRASAARVVQEARGDLETAVAKLQNLYTVTVAARSRK